MILDKKLIGKRFKINSNNLIAFIFSFLLFCILFFSLRGWAYDDPFITYRYSLNISNGDGFVYNINQRVLSTTTPLFSVLLAILRNPFISFHGVANLIGSISLAFGGFTIWLILRNQKMIYAPWFCLIVYPLFPTVIKSVGSETPLYIAIGLLAIYFFQKEKITISAIFAGLIILARPDGILIPTLLVFIFILKNQKIPWKFVLIVILINLPWVIFAWFYFGSPIPITLMVKQNQGNMSISQLFAPGFIGLSRQYLSNPVYWVFLLQIISGIVFFIIRKLIKSQLVVFWIVIYFVAYSILGVSRYYWYYAPIFSAISLVLGVGFEWIAIINSKNIRFILMLVMSFLIIFQIKQFINSSSQIDNRFLIYKSIGLWLNENTDKNSTVGVLEVGIIGFYANRSMMDFAGLITPDVARHMEFQSTYQDTALWAIDNYHPDYLVLNEGFLNEDKFSKFENSCSIVKVFIGSDYKYNGNVNVYECNW